jgi:hypothetical protein
MGATAETSASYRVTTEGELLEVLTSRAFLAMDKIQLVELVTDKMDSPPDLVKCLKLVGLPGAGVETTLISRRSPRCARASRNTPGLPKMLASIARAWRKVVAKVTGAPLNV